MPDLDRFPILRYFTYEHLDYSLQGIPAACASLAYQMADQLADGDEEELRAGLRKLLEANDCFVRAAMVPDHEPGPGSRRDTGAGQP